MNKVFGAKNDYYPIKEDASRVIISYGYEDVDDDNATWFEVYLYKKQTNQLTISVVKDAVIGNINERTDEAILSGFEWNGKPVWLSKENQENYLGALTAATLTEGASLPIKFKLGENENGEPVYHTFTTLNSLKQFYLAGVQYINQCLNNGWTEKDNIDWQPYEEALVRLEEERIAAEEAARQAAEEAAAQAEAEGNDEEPEDDGIHPNLLGEQGE